MLDLTKVAQQFAGEGNELLELLLQHSIVDDIDVAQPNLLDLGVDLGPASLQFGQTNIGICLGACRHLCQQVEQAAQP